MSTVWKDENKETRDTESPIKKTGLAYPGRDEHFLANVNNPGDEISSEKAWNVETDICLIFIFRIRKKRARERERENVLCEGKWGGGGGPLFNRLIMQPNKKITIVVVKK